MTEPDEFDAFYRGTRDALLLQTYALTGDLSASSSAARAAYVVAWHHWAKVSRLPDPEAWVRERAWRQAQRRHTARLWHRDRTLGPDGRATLDALGKLSLTQRKLLLLNLLANDALATMAREVALPRHEAEQELQTATAQFGLHRDVPTTSFRPLFEPLRERTASYRWPRSSIIRRAGAARRRSHTLLGVVGALALLVGSGALVTDTAGARPTLTGGEMLHKGGGRHHHAPAPPPPPPAFSADALLTAGMVGDYSRGRGWVEDKTADNRAGDGIALPCQQAAYADRRAVGALARTFRTSGKPRSTAGQLIELSRTPKAARKAFRETVGWFAGCGLRRVQLLGAHRVKGVGDEAMLLELRDWAHDRTYLAGVARSGRLTSTTETRFSADRRTDLAAAARLMAAGVNGVCSPLGSTCASQPKLVEASAPRAGDTPALLLELDLPPVATVAKPWVGTAPRQALDNVAATGCDRTSFSGDQVSRGITRTYLIPGAGLPAAFGLTETVGAMTPPDGRRFVAGIRKRMSTCEDRDLGTEVVPLVTVNGPKRQMSAWRVTSELDDKHSVTYLMGTARVGTAVGQLAFVPSGGATLDKDAFTALLRRAAERLAYLPPPQ